MTRALFVPATLDLALERLGRGGAVPRAGGTDLFARRATLPDDTDILCLSELRRDPTWVGLHEDGGDLVIGAGTSLRALGADARINTFFPAWAQGLGTLATPQVRSAATVGGALLQEVRCWYFRDPSERCLRRGGNTCLARQGDARHHSLYDLGPCAAAYPSTFGALLLLEDVVVHLRSARGERVLPWTELLSDGRDPRRSHRLEEDELIVAIRVPLPSVSLRGAYQRATSRALAEWPAVEVGVRLRVEGVVQDARICVGAVAPIPLRLAAVESELLGTVPTPESVQRAANRAGHDAPTLPHAAWKAPLLAPLVEDTLMAALGLR